MGHSRQYSGSRTRAVQKGRPGQDKGQCDQSAVSPESRKRRSEVGRSKVTLGL